MERRAECILNDYGVLNYNKDQYPNTGAYRVNKDKLHISMFLSCPYTLINMSTIIGLTTSTISTRTTNQSCLFVNNTITRYNVLFTQGAVLWTLVTTCSCFHRMDNATMNAMFSNNKVRQNKLAKQSNVSLALSQTDTLCRINGWLTGCTCFCLDTSLTSSVYIECFCLDTSLTSSVYIECFCLDTSLTSSVYIECPLKHNHTLPSVAIKIATAETLHEELMKPCALVGLTAP